MKLIEQERFTLMEVNLPILEQVLSIGMFGMPSKLNTGMKTLLRHVADVDVLMTGNVAY